MHALHFIHAQSAVEMGKECAAARRLPFERVTKAIRINHGEHQIALADEMFGGCLTRLFGGGEMNKAVCQINRRTGEGALCHGFIPQAFRGNFIDEGQGELPMSGATLAGQGTRGKARLDGCRDPSLKKPMTAMFRSSGNLNADRRYDYARGAAAEGDHAAAADLLTQTLEIVPDWAPAWFALGEAHEALGARAEAAEAFAKALACEAEDSLGARLRLARLGVQESPAQPPQAYVRDLFDQYAARFETHLVKDLAYRAPQVLRDAILQMRGFDAHFAHALDLGCGTGLMAREMAGHCARIDGCDLAPAMVAKARATGLYQELEAEDLIACLARYEGRAIDLIMAADVFVYCGDLNAIFAQAARVAEPKGVFAFTLQLAESGDYRLGEDLRYAHSRAYVGQLAQAHGFALQICEDVSVRQDRGVPVAGLVVVLAAP